MIFVIDVGNSRIKWGFAVDGEITAYGEDVHPSKLSEFASKYWLDQGQPTAVVISNVAKASLGTRISQWVVRHWRIQPKFIVAQEKACDVINAYIEPSKLGSDRWAAMIAARKISKSPTVIVDCGTAITIDVIDRSGKHLGGLILPGLEMMRSALVTKADRVKFDDQTAQTPELLARDTKGAVVGGTLYASIAAIDRITRDLLNDLGSSTHFLITGGDAAQFLPLLTGHYKHHPHLVLEGLVCLADAPEV